MFGLTLLLMTPLLEARMESNFWLSVFFLPPFLLQSHPFSICRLHLRPLLRLAQKQRAGLERKIIPLESSGWAIFT